MGHSQKRIYFIILFSLFLFLSQVSLPDSRMQAESDPFDLRTDPGVEKIIEEFRSSIPEILKMEIWPIKSSIKLSHSNRKGS